MPNDNIYTEDRENSAGSQDSATAVLKASTQYLKPENIRQDNKGSLSQLKESILKNPNRMNAQDVANRDFRAGVVMVDNSDRSAINASVQLKNSNGIGKGDEPDTSELYKETLGETAYSELKRKCGLKDDASYTDYVDAGGYVPDGWEKESRLLLAEEKRMKLYSKYAAGDMSETDFLYEAYGKDLLKENGYDFESKLFWYNRYKNGDYSDPMDSDTFLSDLISNARSLWQSESWYKDSSNKTLSNSLMGLSTGVQLNESQFESLFNEYQNNIITSLKGYFDNDVKKILTYYQAGYLDSSALNPFFDIDGDGKFDYYFHIDGKLYAIEGSSGTGNATATIEYSKDKNEDGTYKVHSIEINDGAEGAGGAFLEGFRDFWVGFGDLIAMPAFGLASLCQGKKFEDGMAEYEAKKISSNLGGSDYIKFDDTKTSKDWGISISKGVGTVAGMVVMTVATWGIGTALSAGNTGAAAATKEATEIMSHEAVKAAMNATKTGMSAAVKTEAINAIRQGLTTAGQKAATEMTGKTAKVFLEQTIRKVSKDMVKNLGKDFARDLARESMVAAVQSGAATAGRTIAIGTARQVALNTAGRAVANAVAGQNGLFGLASRGKGGTILQSVIASAKSPVGKTLTRQAWVQGMATGVELGVRDFISVGMGLSARNRELEFLDAMNAQNGNPTNYAMSNSEIWTRAGIVGISDAIISGTLRAYGTNGVSAKFGVTAPEALEKAQKMALENSEAAKTFLDAALKHQNFFIAIDAIADVAENVSTMSIQSAMANPYHEIGDVKDFFDTMGKVCVDSAAANIYAVVNDTVTWGTYAAKHGGAPINTSLKYDRTAQMMSMVNSQDAKLIANFVNEVDSRFASDTSPAGMQRHLALQNVAREVEADMTKQDGTNLFSHTLGVAKKLDGLFDEELLKDSDAKKTFIEAMSIDEKGLDALRKVRDTWNKQNPKSQIGLVSAKLAQDMSYASKKASAELYDLVLNDSISHQKAQVASVAKAQQDRHWFAKLFRGRNEAFADALLNQINQAIFTSGYLKDGNGKILYTPLTKDQLKNSFVTKRFDTFEADEIKKTDNQRELDKQEVDNKLKQEGIKSGVFSYDSMHSDFDSVTVTSEGKITYNGNVNNPFIKFFMSYADSKNKNNPAYKNVIDQMIKHGMFDRNIDQDGNETYTLNQTGNWYYYALDNAKHNAIVSDKNSETASIFNTLDLVAYMYEDGEVDNGWNESPFVKLEFPAGNTNNPEAVEIVYVVPNTYKTPYTVEINRLQAVKSNIFLHYQLQKIEAGTMFASASKVQEVQSMILQLGALGSESETTNPFRSVRDELNNAIKANDDAKIKEILTGDTFIRGCVQVLSASEFDVKKDSVRLFSRKQLMELVDNGVLTDEMLDTISKMQESPRESAASDIAKKLIQYKETKARINDLNEQVNKYVGSKKALSEFDQKKVVEDITKINENNELYQLIKEDYVINPAVDKLITEGGENLNFSQGRLIEEGLLEPLAEELSGLDSHAALKRVKDFFYKETNAEDFVHLDVARNTVLDNIRTVFGSILNDNKTFRRWSLSQFLDFIDDPTEYISKRKLQGDELDAFMDRLSVFKRRATKDNKLNKELVLYTALGLEEGSIDSAFPKDLPIERKGTEAKHSLFEKIQTDEPTLLKDLSEIALHKQLTKDDFKMEKGSVLVKIDDTEWKNVADVVLSNSLATTVIMDESFRRDYIEPKAKYVVDLIQYYYGGTTAHKARNVVQVNVLDLLPKEFRKAFTLKVNELATRQKTGTYASISSDAMKKDFENLFKSSGSYMTSQYDQYEAMLQSCAAHETYTLTFDLGLESHLDSLNKLLTAFGYDDELDGVLNNTAIIPGLIYKTIDTHDITTGASYSLFRDYANKYSNDKRKTMKYNLLKKDYKQILYNLFSNATYIDDNTTLSALKNIETLHKGGTIKSGFLTPIYNIRPGADYKDLITVGYGYKDDDRSIKGTLEGGAQLLKYITKAKSLTLDTANELGLSVDQKSVDTINLIRIVSAAIDFLTEADANGKYVFNIKVPKDRIDEFKALYDTSKNTNDSLHTIYEIVSSNDEKGEYTLKVIDDLINANKDSADDLKESIKQKLLFNAELNGFDLKTLLPAWSFYFSDPEVVNAKVSDIAEYEQFSDKSLYWVIANLDIPGYQSEAEIKEKCLGQKQKTEYYHCDRDAIMEFEKFVTDNSNKTLSEVLKDFDGKTNNIYILSYMYQLRLTKAYADYSNDELTKIGKENLVKLLNRKTYYAVGTVLNSGKYDKLFDLDYIPTEAELQAVANDVQTLLGKMKGVSADMDATMDNVYRDGDNGAFTGVDVIRMLGSNYDVNETEITADVIKDLVSTLRGSQNYIMIKLTNNEGFNLTDSFLSGFYRLFDRDEQGNVTLSMEHLMNCPLGEIKQVFEFLDKITNPKTNADYNIEEGLRKQLETLSKELHEKYDILLNGVRRADNYSTFVGVQANERIVTNQPSQIVNVLKGFYAHSEDRKNIAFQQKLVELAMAGELDKALPKTYIEASAMNASDYESNGFKRAFLKLFNETVELYSDKAGSVMVANLDTDAGIANLALSGVSFSTKLSKTLTNPNSTRGYLQISNPTSMQKMCDDIAMHLNVLTSGIAYQSESATSLVVRYNKNGEYEITPLVLSKGNPEKSLYRYFLGQKVTDEFGGNEKDFAFDTINKDVQDNDVGYLLIKGTKDSFYKNIEGCGNDVTVLNIANKDIQSKMYDAMLFEAAIHSDISKFVNTEERSSIIKALKDYYSYSPAEITTRDIIVNLGREFRKQGISDDVIRTVMPTIKAQFVGNETSLTAQVVKDKLGKALYEFRAMQNNPGFEAFTDAIVTGFSNAALTTSDKVAFTNIENELANKYIQGKTVEGKMREAVRFTDSVDVLVNDYLFPSGKEGLDLTKQKIKEAFDVTGLTDANEIKERKEQRAYFVKALMYKRLSGHDLKAIASNGTLQDMFDAQAKALAEYKPEWYQNYGGREDLANTPEDFDKRTVAVIDAEWLTRLEDSDLVDNPTYQISFAVVNPQDSLDEADNISKNAKYFNILIKSNIKQKGLKQKSAPGVSNKDILYVENETTFGDKVKLVDELSSLDNYSTIDLTDGEKAIRGNNKEFGFYHKATTVNDIPTDTYVVATKKDATIMLKRLLADNNVEVVSGMNSRMNEDDVKLPGDNNLLLQDDPNFFKNFAGLDIQDYIENTYSRITEKRSAESVDSFRDGDVLPVRNNAHDAVVDVYDEITLLYKLKKERININDLYNKTQNELKVLFGINDDELKELASSVKFDETLPKHFKESIVDNTNLKVGDAPIKQMLNAYTLQFEHIARRTEKKRLNSLMGTYLDAYDTKYNKAYLDSVTNPAQRKKLASIFLGILKANCATDLTKLKALNEDGTINHTFDEDIRSGLETMASMLSDAQFLFSLDYRNNNKYSYEARIASSKNISKLFFAQSFDEIIGYIAEADYIKKQRAIQTGEDVEKKQYELRAEFKELSRAEREKAIRTLLASDKELDLILNNNKLLDIIKDDERGLIYFRDSQNELVSPLAATAAKDFENQIIEPIMDMFGASKKENKKIHRSKDAIANYLDEDTMNIFAESIANPYRVTDRLAEELSDRAKDNAILGLRRKIYSDEDQVTKKYIESFIGSNSGIFTENLKKQTALWSMGHGRFNFTNQGENGTLYIGEDLLNGRKGFKELKGVYKAGEHFFTIAWRQPLQQMTPMQIIKVEVVSGDTYSFTANTAKNYFNGDFDGDAFNTAFPSMSMQKDLEKLWKIQTRGDRLFYNIFNNKNIMTNLRSEIDLEEKYRHITGEAFRDSKASEAFLKALNSPTDGNIEDAKNAFIASFDKTIRQHSYGRKMTQEERISMAEHNWKTFGVRVVRVASGSDVPDIAIANNPFFSSIKDIDKVITANLRTYNTQPYQTLSLDAEQNGQLAKRYLDKKMTMAKNDVARLFYNSNVDLTEDDIDIFRDLLKGNINDFEKKKLSTNILNYMKTEKVSQDTYDMVASLLEKLDPIIDGCRTGATKSSYDVELEYVAKTLAICAGLIQQDAIASQEFADTINVALPKALENQTKEDVGKYVALYDFLQEQGYNVGEKLDVNDDEFNAVKALTASSELLRLMFDDDQRKKYMRFISRDDLGSAHIYNNLVLQGLDTVNPENRIEVITKDGTVIDYSTQNPKANQTRIGVGEAVIAVDLSETNTFEDTARLVKKTNGNPSMFDRVSKIDTSKYTKKEINSIIKDVKNAVYSFTGKQLNKKLNTNEFDDSVLYHFAGGVTSYGNKFASNDTNKITEPLDTLVFITQQSLYDFAEQNEMKLSLSFAKSAKATMTTNPVKVTTIKTKTSLTGKGKNKKTVTTHTPVLADLSFVNSKYGKDTEFVIGKQLFEQNKMGNAPEYINTEEVNGKPYAFYRVKDLTLLNTANLEAQDQAKPRKIDEIGLIQGAHGLGSAFVFGDLYFSYDKDGNLTFDPGSYDTETGEATGLNGLFGTIRNHKINSSLQDSNAIKNVMFLRIMYKLMSIQDEAKLKEICRFLSDGNCSDIKSLGRILNNTQDLGGDRGFNMDEYLWNHMTDEERTNLTTMLADENNALGRAVYSREIEDEIRPQSPTTYDADGKPIYSKHAQPDKSQNVRTASIRQSSTNDSTMAAMEDSRIDITRGYVSAEGLLRLILSQNGGFLNKTALKAAYENGILDPKRCYLGSLANGYLPINEEEALDIDPRYKERRISARKAGNTRMYSANTVENEAENLFATVTPSIFNDDANRNPLDFSSYKPEGLYDDVRNKYGDKKYKYQMLGPALGFFTNGDTYELYDANNLYMNRFQYNLNRKVPVVSEDGQSIVLDTNTVSPDNVVDFDNKKIVLEDKNYSRERMTAQETKEWIEKNTKSPKQAKILAEKKKLFKNDFDSLCEDDTLSLLGYLAQRENSSSDTTTEMYKIWQECLKEYKAGAVLSEMQSGTETDSSLDMLTKKVYISKNYEDLVNKGVDLVADDNGIKLRKSNLSTMGFKADQNLHIGLERQMKDFMRNNDGYKAEIGGRELALLLSCVDSCPNMFSLLNQYLRASSIVESYNELTMPGLKEKWLKLYGKDKFNKMLEKTNEVLSKNGGDVETLKAKMDSIYKENKDLQVLIEAAVSLNRRVCSEARKEDPFCFLGWFADITGDEGVKRKAFGHTYVKRNLTFKDDFLKNIDYEFDKMPNEKKSSLFYDETYGYIGMIDRIISQIAASRTAKDIGNYCANSGYMRNMQTYNTAVEHLDKVISDYFAKGTPKKDNTDRVNLNKQQYATFLYLAKEACIDTSSLRINYINEGQLYQTYKLITAEYNKVLDSLPGAKDTEEALEIIHSNIQKCSNVTQTKALENKEKIVLLYEDTLAQMSQLVSEKIGNDFYLDLYKKLETLAKESGGVLVDSKGRKIDKAELIRDYTSWKYLEDMVTSYKFSNENNPNGKISDDSKRYYAKQAILGGVYIMNKSVADQLEDKLYCVRKNSYTNKILKKAKNLATSLIMTTPLSLIDRSINFPMFDAGVIMSADIRNSTFMPTATSTITKYMLSGDSLSDEEIVKDKNLTYLIRFLLTTGLNPQGNETVRGEQLDLTTIPGIRQYIAMANKMYNVGNLIPRFAYYLNLATNAEANGYKLDPNRLGVTRHMYDGIVGTENTKGIESSLHNITENAAYKVFNEDTGALEADSNAQLKANLDAQIGYIIAQHNGIEGDMPYLANVLNNNYNTMFLTFPLALVRWGWNRISSIGYSLTHASSSSDSLKYLGIQLGSMLGAATILLAIQMLFSDDTREYLKKKAQGKDDEITEDEKKNAMNILFRGGCVKLFDSLIKGEEVTTAAHNRGPISALVDSYISDFIPAFNDNLEEDGFMKTLWSKIMEKTLGHTNFAIKDVVESIPGNNVLQSTSWYNPDENFFNNYSRKVLAYTMGYSQANAFVDYMQSHGNQDDYLDEVGQAMSYAYTKKYANTKESKSEVKNYKKAFKVVSDYYKRVNGNQQTTSSNSSSDLTKEIRKAVETSNSAADIYFHIQKALQSGASYMDIQKALRSCSIQEKILTMSNPEEFYESLTDSEYDTIKTALLYEDTIYPYLDDILTAINRKERQEYLSTMEPYKVNIANKLRTFNYNTPKNYDFMSNGLSNYNRYSNYKKRYNYNNNYRNNKQSVMDVYNESLRTANNGVSTDIYGNQYKHYTDGSTYKVKDFGSTNLSE